MEVTRFEPGRVHGGNYHDVVSLPGRRFVMEDVVEVGGDAFRAGRQPRFHHASPVASDPLDGHFVQPVGKGIDKE